jgi:anhydro-N-acetylmuramic acid kinase
MMDFYIGLMSGTSLDGVDASLVQTNGDKYFLPLADLHLPYPEDFRKKIKAVTRGTCPFYMVEDILTDYHAKAVMKLLKMAGKEAADIKAIGFHGQTIFHDPTQKITWQIGNPYKLAESTGIDVIHDFRRRDVALKGQGAPLVPVFHKCIMEDEIQPVGVVNIGGVANITYIDKDTLIAFDTGPGNSLIDDAVNKFYNLPFDDQGRLASKGSVDYEFVERILSHNYFQKAPPKSLDRNEFSLAVNKIQAQNPDYIIATLTFLTAKSIIDALSLLPKEPKIIYLCGGGSKNLTLIQQMRELGRQQGKVTEFANILQKKLNPDFIESQAFAYLAARFCHNLPSAFPSTTGAIRPNVCGSIVKV